MYRICKIPAEDLVPVFIWWVPCASQAYQGKRDFRIVKVFSVPQVRQQKNKWHDVKDSQVCFQRLLRNQIHPGQWNSSKVMFGFLSWPGYPSALGSLPDSPGDLPFCSASVSLVFSENTVYSFVCPGYIFLWLTLSCTSPSLLIFPLPWPQLCKVYCVSREHQHYFLELHVSMVWSSVIFLACGMLTRSCSHGPRPNLAELLLNL